jgi:hypothetical protein
VRRRRKNAINCLKHKDIITAGNGFFGVRNMKQPDGEREEKSTELNNFSFKFLM